MVALGLCRSSVSHAAALQVFAFLYVIMVAADSSTSSVAAPFFENVEDVALTPSAYRLVTSPAALAAASPVSLPRSLPALRGGRATVSFDEALNQWSNDTEAEDRSLQSSDTCIPQMIWVVKPATYLNYLACIEEKKADADRSLSVAGASTAIDVECWCEHNMQALIQEIGCCNHPAFLLNCLVQCNDDCRSDAATKCLEECPAICLEQDYAPDGCYLGCPQNCYKHILCITSRSANNTRAGLSNELCDDASFDADSRVANYLDCFRDFPMRTNWHRHNSRAHCICKENVKAAAEAHSCCGARWAQDICHHPCLSEPDCSSTEARQCMTTCRNTCGMVHPSTITEECVKTCFNSSTFGEGRCAQYKSCQPLEPLAFEYVCEDGSSPQSNGCCKLKTQRGGRVQETDGCPILCDQRRVHDMPHGTECQCFQCPTTASAATSKMKEAVVDRLWENGQADLVDIARRVGLELGPTRKMQQMMAERNKELKQMIDAHEGPVDGNLEVALNARAAEWRAEITEEARAFQACQEGKTNEECEEERAAQVEQPAPAAAPAESSDNTLLIVVIAGIVLILGIGIGVAVMVYKTKSQKPAPSNRPRNNPDIEPMDADNTVVVGRPVAPNGASSTQTAEGAPVRGARAGGGNGQDSASSAEKGSSPPTQPSKGSE